MGVSWFGTYIWFGSLPPDPATKKHSVRTIPFEHMGGVFIVIDL